VALLPCLSNFCSLHCFEIYTFFQPMKLINEEIAGIVKSGNFVFHMSNTLKLILFLRNFDIR
jgi:hypothetical protein